jgi:hypothetical protein
MARITVNTTGTQPILQVSLDTSNVANAPLSVTCLQDITITNSTGVYSYTDFCVADTQKLTTPADNEISTNLVIDGIGFFGNTANANTTASYFGVSGLSADKKEISWKLFLNGNANGAFYYTGTGFISSLAPTVSPEAPVWVTPLTIAVDGSMTTGEV